MSGILLLQSCPPKLEEIQKRIFCKGALEFIANLHREFDSRIDQLYKNRLQLAVHLKHEDSLNFKVSAERSDITWKVASLPVRLQYVFLL